jgi:hypothetical protein
MTSGNDVMLEHDPLMSPAAEGQLSEYKHDGFW